MDKNKNYGLNLGLNILVSFDHEIQEWVAHCLELDAVEQGETALEALKNLNIVINGMIEDYVEDKLPLINLAPQKYWDLFVDAEPFSLESLGTNTQFPPNFCIKKQKTTTYHA